MTSEIPPTHSSNSNDETTSIDLVIDDIYAGRRVDQVIAQLLDGWSRSSLQQSFKNGDVSVDGRSIQGKERLYGGETISVRLPEVTSAQDWIAEPVPIDVVYEDAHVTVINKPAGLVVHPGAGNQSGTLVNGLLFRDGALTNLARGGVVHRLDKDTSGLLVCARTEAARLNLIEQLQDRSLHRQYTCVVKGMPGRGSVDQPIGRSRSDRLKMAVTTGGKPAITEFEEKQTFRFHSLLQVRLKTGRTHQIRVHMTWLGYPLLGDPQYGGRRRLPNSAGDVLLKCVSGFKRQALHASRLGFVHPFSGELVQFDSPLPEDMRALINTLRKDVQEFGDESFEHDVR